MSSGQKSRRRKNGPATAVRQLSTECLEPRRLLTATYINAGGPQLSGDPVWETDDAYQNGAGIDFARSFGVNTAGVDPSIPDAVFQSNLRDPRRGDSLRFSIPADEGTEYQVDLLFSELAAGASRVGRRIFDVAIDGDVVLNDFDIFAAAGARTALVESFDVVSDGTINIDLARVRREPTIAGIRITEKNSAPAPSDPPTPGDPPAPNNAPVISTISDQTVNQNDGVGPLSFTVNDQDNDPLSITAASSNPALVPHANITVGGTGTNRTVSLSPLAGASGTATITLTVADGFETASESFTLIVIGQNIPPTNVPPTVNSDTAVTGIGATVTISVLNNDTDSDGTIKPSTVTLTQQPFNGSATAKANGTIDYTPDPGFTGPDSFQYTVNVNLDATSTAASVSVSVTPNQMPVVTPFPDLPLGLGTTSDAIPFTVSDADGDPLTVTATSSNTNVVRSVTWTGTGTGTGANRQLRVTAGDVPGIATVNVTVGDGQSLVQQRFLVHVQLQLNVGGGAVDGFTSASAYHTAATTFVRRRTAISNVPTGLPASVFQSHVWDPRSGPELSFNIPLEAGTDYQVELLFAETRAAYMRPGRRVFDVRIDNELVLNNLDVFSEAGRYSALVKSFHVTSDGNLNIDFQRVTRHPMISGIIITPLMSDDVVPQGPTLNPLNDRIVDVNTNLQLTATATDPAGGALTDAIVSTGLPGSPQIHPTLGTLNWTPTAVGNYVVTLQVTNQAGLTDTESINVTVNAVATTNHAPVLALIPDRQANVGTTLTIIASATDADTGDTVTYFLGPNGPTGAQIDSQTGVLTWQPTGNQIGPNTFDIFASDGTADVSQSVTVIVVDVPSVPNDPRLWGQSMT
ncbi:MAG TPA: hypothetical protein EYG03_07755 [Planctomycetes bacterium]|nr:hypothetical protein [Fuerstiella sp.]HIK91863.1 hypothetical protein [Planctomycetota bacterium]